MALIAWLGSPLVLIICDIGRSFLVVIDAEAPVSDDTSQSGGCLLMVSFVNYPRLKPWACPSIFLSALVQDGVR